MPEQANESAEDRPPVPDMVRVPAGAFRMGSPDTEAGHEDNEYPVRQVVIGRPFLIGRYPVTFAEWDAFAGSAGRPRVADEGWGRGTRPVINIAGTMPRLTPPGSGSGPAGPSACCRRPNGNMPRGPGRSPPITGAMRPIGAARSSSMRRPRRHPGRRLSGAFPRTLSAPTTCSGMCGSGVEDCWNEFYVGAPCDGSAWTSGDCGRRVLRGGSWQDVARQIRCASRNRNGADFGCNDYGFRVACDIQPPRDGLPALRSIAETPCLHDDPRVRPRTRMRTPSTLVHPIARRPIDRSRERRRPEMLLSRKGLRLTARSTYLEPDYSRLRRISKLI